MDAAVVTLFPDMFRALRDFGVSRRAIDRGLVSLTTINPRDYAVDRHGSVDDRPYGGGPGMVMRVEPLKAAVAAARAHFGEEQGAAAKVIYLSPQGQSFDRNKAKSLADCRQLILIAGRYEGVDERFLYSEVDEELSIGDYVLSGGEFPAMVVLDAIIRYLPGALGDEQSAEQDSFENGLLDCPHYTRPEIFAGMKVPDVLLSGDHEKIALWRLKQALGRTADRRPDLLEKIELNSVQKNLLKAYFDERK